MEKIIPLPVSEKDKSDKYFEAIYECKIVGRGNDWIIVEPVDNF